MGAVLSSSCPSTSDSTPPPSAPHVVVVGASFAGLAATRQLADSSGLCRVTVVEPRDHFEYTPGILRALVAPEKAAALLVPLPRVLGDTVTWVRGWLSRVEEGEIIVTPHPPSPSQSPLRIPFDYLVLCTGSGYASPIKAPTAPAYLPPEPAANDDPLSLAHRVKTLVTEARNMVQAPNLLIVGGGTVGVELAAEAVWRYPKGEKQVVIVNRASRLLPALPQACGEAALRWLEARGVTVILGDELEDDGMEGGFFTREIRTRNGRRLIPSSPSANKGNEGSWLVYRCTGPTPSAPAYLASSGMDADGWLHADGKLRVRRRQQQLQQQSEGKATLSPLVLAAGDVMQQSEAEGVVVNDDKTAFAAELQGEAAAHQILAAIRRARERPGEDVQGHEYPASLVGKDSAPLVYCVSLGPYDGVLVFNDVVASGFVLGRVAALAKHFIEVTKLWEATGVLIARLFWLRVAHPITFFLHRNVFRRSRRTRGGRMEGDGVATRGLEKQD